MDKIKIHVLHTGSVLVSSYLPFGGDNCNILKASGIFEKKSSKIWLPVSVYLIEHPTKGLILVDCGWNRDISPEGTYNRWNQIKSLNSFILFLVNQAKLEKGEAINEQLENMNIKSSDLDYILLTHLDCDHVNGLRLVKDAKNILVSADEIIFAKKNSKVRYQEKWWSDVPLKEFKWNNTEGPFNKSYDLFGDGTIELINIPGHADGLFAVKIKNSDGKFVLLASDGAYAEKSWKEMISPGIATDREKQRISLEWIRQQSLDKNCIKVLANHDPDVVPHIIEL